MGDQANYGGKNNSADHRERADYDGNNGVGARPRISTAERFMFALGRNLIGDGRSNGRLHDMSRTVSPLTRDNWKWLRPPNSEPASGAPVYTEVFELVPTPMLTNIGDVFLPAEFPDGSPVPASQLDLVRRELLEQFGGVTSFDRAPAQVRWQDAGQVKADAVIVMEVMTPKVDKAWWRAFRQRMERPSEIRNTLIEASTSTASRQTAACILSAGATTFLSAG